MTPDDPRGNPLEWAPKKLPKGWELTSAGAHQGYRHRNGLLVLCTARTEIDGKRWVHLSCSRLERLPSWDDLTAIRNIFLGREALALQVVAPASEHFNYHPNCLHLWHCLDGRPVPEFRQQGAL